MDLNDCGIPNNIFERHCVFENSLQSQMLDLKTDFLQVVTPLSIDKQTGWALSGADADAAPASIS